RLLAFEDASGATMAHCLKASRLQNGAVRAEVAFEDGEAAIWRERRVEPMDDLAIGLRGGGEFLGESAAGNSERIAVEVAAPHQLAQHYRRPTDLVNVAREIFATGLQIADQRRAGKDSCDVVDVKLDASLVGDGGDVQDGIGGAAGGV